jgi:hypothetical protein
MAGTIQTGRHPGGSVVEGCNRVTGYLRHHLQQFHNSGLDSTDNNETPRTGGPEFEPQLVG